jgi:hypothetical protein
MPKVEVDTDHLMEDLARMYDSGSEMVVSEVFGNAVDVSATKLDVILGEDSGVKYIKFMNNGPTMTREDFVNYNTLARSSKKFGEGLGWAGIGAKLYLGIWQDSKIITTSSDGITTTSTELYFKEKQLFWDYIQSSEKFQGTSYKAYLTEDDYAVLETKLEEIIQKLFNSAMLNGMKVTVNGKTINPWSPSVIKTIDCVLKIGKINLSYKVWITDSDIPSERCNIEYHVSGKCIIIKKPKNLLSTVKAEYKKKFYVIVDAKCISDQLKTNKHNFKPGIFTTDVEPGIEKELYRILKELKYLDDPTQTKSLHDKFSKTLEDIIKKQLKELNLESLLGKIGGTGTQRGNGDKTPKHSTPRIKTNAKKTGNPKKPKRKGGFSFTTVLKPTDTRQGWINVTDNQIVVNLGHRVAIPQLKTRDGRQYHLLRIISNELVKYAARSGKFTVEQAFELTDKVFDLMAKANIYDSKTPWNFIDSKQTQRDENGQFIRK